MSGTLLKVRRAEMNAPLPNQWAGRGFRRCDTPFFRSIGYLLKEGGLARWKAKILLAEPPETREGRMKLLRVTGVVGRADPAASYRLIDVSEPRKLSALILLFYLDKMTGPIGVTMLGER